MIITGNEERIMSGQKLSTSCVIILRLTSPNPGNLWEPSYGHCAHQGQGLQQTVSLGSRPSNLSSWVFWHVITRAPTAYHHLSCIEVAIELWNSVNATFRLNFWPLSGDPPEWQGFLKLMCLTNPARWDAERVQNAWESMKRAESQLARGVHVLCKIQIFDNH